MPGLVGRRRRRSSGASDLRPPSGHGCPCRSGGAAPIDRQARPAAALRAGSCRYRSAVGQRETPGRRPWSRLSGNSDRGASPVRPAIAGSRGWRGTPPARADRRPGTVSGEPGDAKHDPATVRSRIRATARAEIPRRRGRIVPVAVDAQGPTSAPRRSRRARRAGRGSSTTPSRQYPLGMATRWRAWHCSPGPRRRRRIIEDDYRRSEAGADAALLAGLDRADASSISAPSQLLFRHFGSATRYCRRIWSRRSPRRVTSPTGRARHCCRR
jgi:hypothetical protein